MRVCRTLWTIAGAFPKLTDVLRCAVETLGYPKAALFSFALAALAFNLYAVGRVNFLTDRSQQPHRTAEEIAAGFNVSPALLHA